MEMCPVCSARVPVSQIETHVIRCLDGDDDSEAKPQDGQQGLSDEELARRLQMEEDNLVKHNPTCLLCEKETKLDTLYILDVRILISTNF